MKKILFLALLSILSSCSFFNHKGVELGVDSSPQGAEIYINDQFYGVTPKIVTIAPKETFITLDKKGYGSTSFKAPIFIGSIRTKANGSINADGVRCLLDFTSVLFFFQAYTGNCADFKEKQYKVTIPNNQRNQQSLSRHNEFNNSGFGYSNSIVGVGSDPQNVINYYYDKEATNNQHQNKYLNPYDNKDYNKAR